MRPVIWAGLWLVAACGGARSAPGASPAQASGPVTEAADPVGGAEGEAPAEGWYNAACYAARDGDVDRSLQLLVRSIEAGEAPLSWMARDPDLTPTRALPGYRSARDAALERYLEAHPPEGGAQWMAAAAIRTLQGRSAQAEVEAAEAAGHVHAIFQAPVSAQTDGLAALATRQAAYTAERRGTIVVENPDAFEIVNLVLSQTTYGQQAPSAMLRDGPYWEAVQAWFGPHRDHPLIRELDAEPVDMRFYYGFRNHGAAWRWTGEELVPGGVYPVQGAGGMLGGAEVLTPRIASVAQFARDTDVAGFFATHGHHREQMLERYRERVPLQDMWDWLEAAFPASTDGRDALVVRTSLLIGGSHNASTATLAGADPRFVEGTMVSYSGGSGAWEPEDIAGLARTVFTEIDHHYVNPVSIRHQADIEAALGGRLDRFNQQGSDNYGSAFATFNEYVTWVLFDRYWDDYCDRTGASDSVRAAGHRDTERVMARRKFGRFAAFRAGVLPLLEEASEVEAVFPAMIRWFADDRG